MNKKSDISSAPALRLTRQRRLILEEFQTPGRHHTADDVHLRVRKKLPSISLGTVYRNLDILSRAGLVRKIDQCGRQSLYDGGLHQHYHVRCVQCGKVCDVCADRFPALDALAGRTSDFEILGHELEFEGLCPGCKSERTTSGDK